MTRQVRHWLLKSDVDSYAIDDLARDGATCWDGVRNYQARNFMRDDMKTGDLALFYHSGADPPGVAGIARVCKPACPDHTAWKKGDMHFDPKASPENPIWMMVDVAFVEKFTHFVSLDELKNHPDLADLQILRRGNRLSITPVSPDHFALIRTLGRRKR